MVPPISRRKFLHKMAFTPVVPIIGMPAIITPKKKYRNNHGFRHKLSLNVYSFNKPLRDGLIDLFDVLDFCSEHHFDAIDPTGYYFPGYPEVPSDEFIREFKRKAFLLGLDISGTGVRNDFTNPDAALREADIEMIRAWTEAAAKLGAPALRIFAGHHEHGGFSRDDVLDWMVKDISICCQTGEKYGVMMAVQNHNGFLKTADDVNQLLTLVQSGWLGLNLDIGSYRQHPPYQEIKKNIDKAITWQIKENVWIDGQETPTDFVRLFRMIKESGYRGYLPLETLGPGNPFEKVPILLEKVRDAWEIVEK